MKKNDITSEAIANSIQALINEMTLDEKIGQLSLVNSEYGQISADTKESLKAGRIGGMLNEVAPEIVNELQRIAVEESRLGIPLLIGRDIIHGFNTIFPIPLGMAATWNESLIEECCRVAAQEASAVGVNWTYAPMVDISRDPRWGRVAESLGEDPALSSILTTAMIKGFQGEQLSQPGTIAACVKHFAGYGACESGKDYNTTNIPENELRNVHLAPFKAAIDAGAMSLMTSFSDIDGIPASANHFLLRHILREEWDFKGMVVSDWASITQLAVHGLTEDEKDSAAHAANAGVDMEMASHAYADNLAELVNEGKVSIAQIDLMVEHVLRVKFQLGLFENPYTNEPVFDSMEKRLELAKETALQSCVLLRNEKQTLPLNIKQINSIAVMGPMADEPAEQLGTWVFDGDQSLSQTPLKAFKEVLPENISLNYVRSMETSRSRDKLKIEEAVAVAEKSDVILFFAGEEAILSGESHCRSDIRLPGAQEELISALSKTGKPLVLILMAGRPVAMENIYDKVDAILCAWHPGCMAGPAIIDLLLGVKAPSGKLPITFPRVTGQIPIYYGHKNTGRPATDESVLYIDDIEVGTPQHSFGNTSFHLDVDNSPLYPFGFGLSYTTFEYSNLKLSQNKVEIGGCIFVTVDITNKGAVGAYETVQLYTRDLVGSVTRPVKELKKIKKIYLKPGQKETVSFVLATDDLAFYGRDNKLHCEPGAFHLWVGSDSNADLKAEFEII